MADKDFFISYAGADRAWAEWIAWQLTANGYQTTLQAWDFRPGSNFVEEMNRALEQSERTIAVLSPAYLKSAYGRDEWTAAFVHDEAGRPRLLLVRVEDVEPPALLRPLVYVDLVGLEAERAQELLLAGVRQEALRPTAEPGYPPEVVRPAEDEPRFPHALPPTWNLPWPRNPAFTGRMELLGRLRAAMTDVTGGPAVVALAGMGGVGKSQLVLEYAYRWQADYDRVWWVRAEQPATLLADYAALAGELELPERRDPDQRVVVEATRSWLEQNRRWLLVLDNAEDAASIRPVLPRGGGGGVVITSRNPVWRRDATVLPVEVLDWGEAVAFLLERTGQADATAAGQLAEALGDLPLALEQAGAYVDEQGIPLAGYTRQLRTRAPELFAAGQPPDYENTVATTWTVSFQVIEQASPVTAELLRLCAFLGPDAIPSDLLSQGADLLPEPLGRVAAGPDELAMAIAPARRYALMKVINNTLSMHRLVQVVVRHQLNPEQQQWWATTALRLVRGAFPAEHTNPEAWPVYAQLLPHAQVVTNHSDMPEIDHEATAWLLNEAGLYLWQRADYQQARGLLERALAIRQTYRGPDHPDTATSVSNLAHVLRAEGDLAGARSLYERALAIRETCLGADHPDTAASLNNLANVLYDQGKLERARALHERALAIRQVHLEPDHPETGWSFNNLAVVLGALGDLNGACILHQRALAIREARLGPDHPHTAISLHSLGVGLQDKGDLDAARRRLERALAIREARLGPDHPSTVQSREALAAVVPKLDRQ